MMKLTLIVYIGIIITCVFWVISGRSAILPIIALMLIATDIEFRLKREDGENEINEDVAALRSITALKEPQKALRKKLHQEPRKAKISA